MEKLTDSEITDWVCADKCNSLHCRTKKELLDARALLRAVAMHPDNGTCPTESVKSFLRRYDGGPGKEGG